MNSLLSVIEPWKMFPPVRLKVDSMSTGLRICRSMTDDLKPGAYCSTTSKQRSAKSLRAASSHVPSRSEYGAYWQNIDMRCLPGGATVGSTDDGIVHSTTGSRDGRPYFASSYPRSM